MAGTVHARTQITDELCYWSINLLIKISKKIQDSLIDVNQAGNLSRLMDELF